MHRLHPAPLLDEPVVSASTPRATRRRKMLSQGAGGGFLVPGSRDGREGRAIARFASSRMGRRYLTHTGLEPEQAAAENMVGAPQEVADRLHLFAEAGMTQCLPTHIGVETFEEYLDQFRRYVDQVIPCYERG